MLFEHSSKGMGMFPRFRLRRRSVLQTCVLIFVFSWLFSRHIEKFLVRTRQTHPFSYQHQVERAFTPTQLEIACQNGDTKQLAKSPGDWNKAPIPNVVHFIYGLRNPATHPHAGTFDFLCYLAVRSAIVAMKPEAIYLHYTYLSYPPSPDPHANPMSNSWIRRLSKHIKLVHHPPDEFKAHQGHWQAAHVSDVLRLELLERQGGIYLDIDAFALRPFGALLKSPRDIVLGHEGGNRYGLCNAVMAARPGSSFVRNWLRTYDGADLSKEWNYHSVVLPKEMMARSKELEDEVCALSPDSFFWPTWTWNHIEWMHQPLSKEEAAKVTREIQKNGGSLFERQVAYHAWNQMAWDRYLKHLTPWTLRNRDTRFNLLMRRFLEDDVI